MDAAEPLVVGESVRGHARTLAVVGTVFVVMLTLVVILHGRGWSLLWIGLLTVPSVLGIRAARRGDWTVRIDADGIHWPDGTRLPWGGIAEIRVTEPRNPVTRYLGSGAFGLQVVTTAQADFARRAGVRPIGRVIPDGTLTASPDEILAAVHRFADVPVVRTGRIQRSDRGRTV